MVHCNIKNIKGMKLKTRYKASPKQKCPSTGCPSGTEQGFYALPEQI